MSLTTTKQATPVRNSSTVLLTPVNDDFIVIECFSVVNDTAKKFFTGANSTGKGNLTGVNDTCFVDDTA
jgi:hypothetical protein